MRVGNSSLGKGEVVSSILTGSTTKKPISQCFRTDLEWLHVKRHPELHPGRHEELTPLVLADVKQAASKRALK
jgi:hypothetical protein